MAAMVSSGSAGLVGAADGMDQRGFRAQEPLLDGVENGDQRALGNIETLAQQIDTDQHIKLP